MAICLPASSFHSSPASLARFAIGTKSAFVRGMDESPLCIVEARHRIIVVDDEESYRDLFLHIFKEDWAVECFARAEPALDRIREAGADLLIVDLRMPGTLNGFMVASEARRVWPNMPCILVSGFVDAGDLEQRKILARYCDACLSKPFGIKVLLRLVKDLMARRNEGDLAVPTPSGP